MHRLLRQIVSVFTGRYGRRPTAKSIKRIVAYMRDGSCHIHSTHVTKSGIPVFARPCVEFRFDDPDERIASVIHECISGCRDGLPDVKDFKGHLREMLSCFNAKSWRDLVFRRTSVGIDQCEGVLIFTPLTNEGAKGGYAGKRELERRLPIDSTPEAIAEALRSAFADSD